MVRVAFVVAALSATLLVAAAASAQMPSGTPPGASPPAAPGDLKSQYDAAFQETLTQPANLDVLFRFAGLATQTGDLEGAISALERMLVINPDIPRVRLELGVLYYRLGSYEAARTYLESALNSPTLPPDIRDRAEQFMAETRKRLSPSRLSGEAFLGFRYQSNANLGPGANVLLFGLPATLNQAATGTPDWGVVSSLLVDHVWDFGSQDKAALETRFVAFANRQFTLGTTDITLFDLMTGPRFQVFRGIFEDVSIKPFVNVGDILLYDTQYYFNYGGGVETGIVLADRLRNTSLVRWRRQNHPDTWYLPTNSQFTGTEYTAVTGFAYQLTSAITLFANGSSTRFEADLTPVQSYQLWGVGGGMAFRFADPLFRTTLPWSIGVSYTQQWWTYDQPDPTTDPNNMRQQLDSILSVVLSVPFDNRTTLTISGGRFLRTSNVPNFAFENDTAMVGVSWRF